ncbi:MAG: hypothetical protein ACI92E_002408 [Oceanicoccus sp.]|jgi:hypothetical protein
MDELELQEQSKSISTKSTRHLIVGVTLLIIFVASFTLGLINIKKIFEKVSLLEAVQPSSRFDFFNAEIDRVKQLVADQYAVHTVKMDDKDIRDMNLKFNLVYRTAYDHERDLGSLVKNYQETIYQMSSRTRGSGEWFEFYNRDIEKLKEGSIERQSKLIKYTSSVR